MLSEIDELTHERDRLASVVAVSAGALCFGSVRVTHRVAARRPWRRGC
jgi:hypothetical protein